MLNDDDRQQVEELFRRYGKGVGSYVLVRVGDRNVAESITANVFLIVVRRFDQCRGSAVAWMWSIVRSEIARHFRDRREVGSAQTLEAEPVDRSCGPSGRAECVEDDARMRLAVERLGEEQQALVYMKFFLDMPNVEIAAALDITATNVGVKVHRAVRRLRELMVGRAAPDGPGGENFRKAIVTRNEDLAYADSIHDA